MTRYDGRLSANVGLNITRQPVLDGLAWKKHTMATQVWLNDSISGSASDTLYFGKLPRGAAIVGGRVYSARLASGSSAACCCMGFCLGVDVICYNGSGVSFSTASLTSGLGLFSPMDFNPPNSATSYLSGRTDDSGFNAPLGGILLTQGPLYLQADGSVFGTMLASAGTGSGISGYLNLELDYLTAVYA